MSARSQISGHFKNFKQLTADRSIGQQQISLLEQKTAEKLKELDQTIALRRTQGLSFLRSRLGTKKIALLKARQRSRNR